MKKRILLLAAFALMALMAPLGAKGQDYTGLTVRQARNHAGDNHSVQFTGYVAHFVDNGPNSTASLFVQDNDLDGAGIEIFAPHSLVANVQTGYKISVTATEVTIGSSDFVCVGSTEVTNVTVLATNTLPSVITPSLQGMKDMHYPATSIPKIIADPFQSRLVRLNWLKVVQHLQNSHFHGWVVEDLNGVRDTLSLYDIYPRPTLTVGAMYKRVVAVNSRHSDNSYGGYNKLRVRSMNDLEEANLVTMQEARQLATQSNQTGTEVSVIGVVSFARFGDWNSGEIYMQTPNGGSGYGGMKVVTVGDPASRGITTGTKIIVTGTPRVINTDGYPYGPGHNNAPDMVAMMDVDVTSITVISQDAPYSFGNKTLADLRQNNPTISNVKNNTYQHNMVKLNNLTVVQHLDDKTYHGETYHYYEVSQGSGNNTVTDVLLSRDELAQNMVLPSVKVVNCRSNMLDSYHYDSNLGLSGDNHPNHLLLRSLSDIDFNTKSISYVRTHRDAPYYVEGVITARIPCEEIPGGYSVFIQDNTGGLRVDLYPELASQLAIGDRCIARVQSELADIIDVYMFAYCDFITKIGSNESFTPYNGVSLAQLYAIPNLGNNIPSLNFDGRYYQFPTMQMKVRSRSHGQQGQPDEYLYVEFSQTGQNNQTMLIRMTVYKNSVNAADFDALYNSISLTTEDVTVNLKGTLSVLYDENDYDVYHFYLYPSKFSDIEIDYTSQHTVTVTEYPATQSGTHTQQAEAGETVTLQLSHINATDTYEFVSDEYSNTVWMSPHHLICTSHPDLQLTKVNTYTYRFTMPNGNVDFEAVYTPDVIHMSDVWEARAEGSPDGNPEKLAYLTCVVTDVKNELWFFIQDLNNQNCGNDELKMYQGMEVFLERGCELNVGDVVEVCGYPVNDDGVRVSITNGRILSHEGTAVAQLYATTLNDLWNDLHGSGQTVYNTRLQDRLIQLDNLIVESEYQVGQTIGNIHRIANIQAPFNLNLEVGAPLNLTALNFSDIGGANSGDLWLDLRSANDIVQDTDITFGTYSMDFDEFGSGYTDYGNHITYHYVNIPMTLGGSLSNPVINWSDDWIVGNPGTNYEEPPVIQMDNKKFRFVVTPNPTTETRTCTITISANGFTSQPFVITQTGCGPAEFTVSPDFQSFGPVDPNYSKGQYSQSGYINITDISHVAQPYGSHITTSVASAYTGQNTDWFSLGAWDAESQRFPFTIANNNDPSSVTRGVNVAIIMEGTDGTLVQHEAAVHQSGPGASVTVTPNWWSAEAPLCQEVTKTFEVNYTNFNLAVNPARIWLEASDFNDDDVEVSIEPSPASPVELTEAAGTIYYQVTFLVKNAGSHYGTFMARVQQYDQDFWWDSFDSQEASVWVSGLHPGNIDTNATSTETLNSLGFPTWFVMDPDTYQFVDTLSFIQVSIASEALGQQAEMVMFDPENGSYVTCMPFDPTYVSGNSTLIPLHDGTYLIQLGGSWLAWDSDQGLHDEWISLNTPDDIANIPAKNKWNISFSGDNAIISPSTNPNYSLRCQSVTVTEPDPENWEEMITRIEYRIACVNDGGSPLQIFYHIEGELPSPTLSSTGDYFEEGQSVTITLTPAENTTLAYTLEEDYDNPVTSNVPVTLTFTETTKVIAWSMLECQTYSLDGLVEHTYYNINTIAEARANANMECYIHGIVSSADHVHNRYFVQDETSGVEIGIDWTIWENVYNNHDSLVALQNGDEIVLKGWCDEYGMFTGATYDWNSSTTYDEPEVAKLSMGNTVAPLLVTFDELYETTDAQYLGRLVKLENEQVTVWAGNPETYQLRHGTPEEPYYLEFPRYMENEDTQFSLNDGDLIDLTAVYDGGFSNPKEITVKTPRSYDMQAYTDVDLTQPNTGWDSHIKLCDAYGNILNPNALYAGDKVYFTFDDGYGVGYNAYLLPVAAVYSDATNDLIADTYTNFQMGVTYMNNSRDRLFSFDMPDEDVVIRVYLMNAYTLTVYNNNMTQVFENVTLYFGSVNTMGIPESWLDNYYMTAGSVATGEAITMPYTVTANTTLTSVYQHGDEKYGRVFYQNETMTNLVIERPSVVLSDVTLTLGDLTSTNAADFVIEEGGSVDILSTDMSDNRLATVRRSIVGYGDDINVKNGWYLISTPFCEEIDPASVTNMIPNNADDYDLYTFSQSHNKAEWRNYKDQGNNLMLKPMEGQLYANKDNVELSMAGNLMAAPREIISGPAISLSYTAGNQFAGWNLVGNPFLVEAYMKNVQNYYRLQDVLEGGVWTSKLIAETGATPLDPMQGVFVQTDQTRWLEMVKEQPVTNNNQGLLDITVSQSTERGSSTLDRAMVRFGEGGMLGKFSFRDGGTQLYIPQGSKDYAVVSTAMQGEVPVNFKASRSGSYTISVEATNAEMEYLHLIDNLTGADVDLLVEPSYTFESHTTDYASRFRLVFSSICEDADGDNETFAYYNGSEWVIANTGRATLQVVDVMGRILNSETIDGNATAHINGTPGVYMMRLINGEKVMVQKVVVR